MPVAESGKNTRVIPSKFRFLGPVPEYGPGGGLGGVCGRKSLKSRGQKIDKVCDRVLRRC